MSLLNRINASPLFYGVAAFVLLVAVAVVAELRLTSMVSP
jgi:hypothetical protein